MPSLNSERYIGAALDSVVAQNYLGKVEVILADGGSGDRTLSIAQKYDFVNVLEGGDDGIYDGFNRGIRRASYEVIGILNSDDLLHPGALEKVALSFSQSQSVDFISGAVTSGNSEFDSLNTVSVNTNNLPLSTEGALFGVPAINGRFFQKQLFKRIGEFAPNSGIAADREFLFRAARMGTKSVAVNEPLYHYREHEGSTTLARDDAARGRVWKAELDLARYLLTDKNLDANAQDLLRRSRMLVGLKSILAPAELHKIAKLEAGALLKDWDQIIPALLSWRKWRGRLSGH